MKAIIFLCKLNVHTYYEMLYKNHLNLLTKRRRERREGCNNHSLSRIHLILNSSSLLLDIFTMHSLNFDSANSRMKRNARIHRQIFMTNDYLSIRN